MSFKESDIVYEEGLFWVLLDHKHKCYTVYRQGVCASEADSSYEYNDSGLSIALARAKYLARKRQKENV